MNNGQNGDPDIEKLIHLLKKILKKDPQSAEQFKKMFDAKGFNLNVCFLTFIPMTLEEIDELNERYEDAVGYSGLSLHRDAETELEFKLTRSDIEFLKKNGIHFE